MPVGQHHPASVTKNIGVKSRKPQSTVEKKTNDAWGAGSDLFDLDNLKSDKNAHGNLTFNSFAVMPGISGMGGIQNQPQMQHMNPIMSNSGAIQMMHGGNHRNNLNMQPMGVNLQQVGAMRSMDGSALQAGQTHRNMQQKPFDRSDSGNHQGGPLGNPF